MTISYRNELYLYLEDTINIPETGVRFHILASTGNTQPEDYLLTENHPSRLEGFTTTNVIELRGDQIEESVEAQGLGIGSVTTSRERR